jgi:hypothetical protein
MRSSDHSLEDWENPDVHKEACASNLGEGFGEADGSDFDELVRFDFIEG